MDLFGDLPPPADDKIERKTEKTENDVGSKRKFEDNKKDQNLVYLKKLKDNGFLQIKSYIAERKGEREDMQDASTLIDDCTVDYQSCQCGIVIKRVSFFGVYDGHGGSRASTYLKDHLHENIKSCFPTEDVLNFDKELKRCLKKAFKQTDDEFLNKARKVSPPWRDGSTASCVLLINDTIYAANVGDTKTILIRKDDTGKNKVITLSKDHSPTEYSERQRIQNAGGFVRDGRVQGVLEVSRAIGDLRYKKYVIPTPEICKATITCQDKYILIACDGLWKVFTNTEAVDYIDMIVNKLGDTIDNNLKYENVCKELASEAVRRGSSDNVTVVLVRIHVG